MVLAGDLIDTLQRHTPVDDAVAAYQLKQLGSELAREVFLYIYPVDVLACLDSLDDGADAVDVIFTFHIFYFFLRLYLYSG